MTINREGRAGCNQATPKTSKYTRNFNGLIAGIEAATVTLAVWGLLSLAVACWLLHLGGLRDV